MRRAWRTPTIRSGVIGARSRQVNRMLHCSGSLSFTFEVCTSDRDTGEMMGAEESKSSRMPMAYDATDDIQDIDRRLNALQQFLTAAKAPR